MEPRPRTQIKLCDVLSVSYTMKVLPGKRPNTQELYIELKDDTKLRRVVRYTVPNWTMRQAQFATGQIAMGDALPNSEDVLNHFACKPIPFGDDVKLVYDDATRARVERQLTTMRVVGNLPELFQMCRAHALKLLNECSELDEEDMERMRVICSAFLRLR